MTKQELQQYLEDLFSNQRTNFGGFFSCVDCVGMGQDKFGEPYCRSHWMHVREEETIDGEVCKDFEPKEQFKRIYKEDKRDEIGNGLWKVHFIEIY